MGVMASQITSLTIVYSTVHAGEDQRKHQSSASLAFVRGIRRWTVNSPHKWPVTWKVFPFDDVIMPYHYFYCWYMFSSYNSSKGPESEFRNGYRKMERMEFTGQPLHGNTFTTPFLWVLGLICISSYACSWVSAESCMMRDRKVQSGCY